MNRSLLDSQLYPGCATNLCGSHQRPSDAARQLVGIMVMSNGHANGVQPQGNKEVSCTQNPACQVDKRLIRCHDGTQVSHLPFNFLCHDWLACTRLAEQSSLSAPAIASASSDKTCNKVLLLQLRFPSVHDDTVSMTTNVGTPVVSNQNSESIGRRGACYLSLHGFDLLRLRLFALHVKL